jgi:hypothetical protein
MDALTLTQPYATLVMLGVKEIETRGWSTTLRGRIAIHAGKGLGPVGGERGLVELLQDQQINLALSWRLGTSDPAELVELLPRGVVLGDVELYDSVALTMQGRRGCYYQRHLGVWARVSERETAFGNFAAGRFGFRLRYPQQLETPIRARGFQKFWSLPDHIAQQLETAPRIAAAVNNQ